MKSKTIYMKKMGIVGALLFALFTSSRPAEATHTVDCMMAVTYSEMAYGQFKKVNKASSLNDAKKALKKGAAKCERNRSICRAMWLYQCRNLLAFSIYRCRERC